jgi:glutamine synthetase
VSLVDLKTGKNAFSRDSSDTNAKYGDYKDLSDVGRQFLAGVIEGLPDIMPLFAPTINSYKRLVENFWAPVTVSWGFEHRVASVRVIGQAGSSATRLEIRVPGADMNPHYSISAILLLGLRGIKKKLDIRVPPMEMTTTADTKGERLPKSLASATEKFMAPNSIAREIFGDDFVDHFGGTRLQECRLWYAQCAYM